MNTPLKLMCILAHPDDESLGLGGILAKYQAEGVETYLLTATRGQIGWFGAEEAYPGVEALGQIREAELRAATRILNMKELTLLDYIDGQLDQVDEAEIVHQIVAHLRRIRPDVVVTFDPFGIYGHPDHIAISQFATAAVAAADDPNYVDCQGQPPHAVQKFYYRVGTEEELAVYQDAFGELVMHVNGQERRAKGWEPWAVTTCVDTHAYWSQIWQAVSCHQTQLPGYQTLQNLSPEQHQTLWGQQTYYRVFSLANGRSQPVEDDLFAGLR